MSVLLDIISMRIRRYKKLKTLGTDKLPNIYNKNLEQIKILHDKQK